MITTQLLKTPSAIIRRIGTYWNVWWLVAKTAFQETFVHRGTNALFITGKALRLIMSLVFLWLIKNQVTQFAGYTTDELVVFFITYLVLDVVVQALFRGVYIFGFLVKRGIFDTILIKPISPLFQALTGKPDINDALFLLPTLALCIWTLTQLQLNISAVSAIWYGLLLLNAMVIATSLQVIILSISILTTDVDGLIWLYRDVSRLGQFPVSIYWEPLRLALFFLVPIGMMVTIPAEVLLQLPPTQSLGVVGLTSAGFVLASLWLWRQSLRQYTSASN